MLLTRGIRLNGQSSSTSERYESVLMMAKRVYLINYVHDTMTKDEQREWLPIIDEGLIFEMQYDYLGVDWLYTDIGIGGAILYHEGEEVVPPHDIADDDEDIGV